MIAAFARGYHRGTRTPVVPLPGRCGGVWGECSVSELLTKPQITLHLIRDSTVSALFTPPGRMRLRSATQLASLLCGLLADNGDR